MARSDHHLSVDKGPATLGDRYQLTRIVGRGGMGEVWAASDLRLGRQVAIKLLSPHLASDPGVRERFEAEARAAAGLNHPNVVAVYDSGEHEGVPFLVMELLPGRTLADEVAEGPLGAARATTIAIEVLAALAVSHAAGVLHRDIKPANVLLAADGTAKVGDFGIAKSTEGLDLTMTGTIIGTAAYLAPERLAGEAATPAADFYAVGVLLYEALSGRKPFDADTPMGVLRAVETHDPVPLAEARPDLDASLVAAVERAMAKDPRQRFADAGAMAAALRPPSAIAGPGAHAVTVPNLTGPATKVLTPPTPPARPVDPNPGPTPRHRGAPAVAALVVVVVVAVVVLLTTRGDETPSTSPPTGQATAGAELPEPLERAVTSLEEAVRP